MVLHIYTQYVQRLLQCLFSSAAASGIYGNYFLVAILTRSNKKQLPLI